MVHSYSAAGPGRYPDDRRPVGWRRGHSCITASVNEPFLQAVSDASHGRRADRRRGSPRRRAAAERASSSFGRPWRLIYLGDPLYRLPAPGASPGVAPTRCRNPAVGFGSCSLSPVGWNRGRAGEPRSRSAPADRLAAADWRKIAPEYADWPVVEVAVPASSSPSRTRRTPRPGSDQRLLAWCRDAAIRELIASAGRGSLDPGPIGRPSVAVSASNPDGPGSQPANFATNPNGCRS